MNPLILEKLYFENSTDSVYRTNTLEYTAISTAIPMDDCSFQSDQFCPGCQFSK